MQGLVRSATFHSFVLRCRPHRHSAYHLAAAMQGPASKRDRNHTPAGTQRHLSVSHALAFLVALLAFAAGLITRLATAHTSTNSSRSLSVLATISSTSAKLHALPAMFWASDFSASHLAAQLAMSLATVCASSLAGLAFSKFSHPDASNSHVGQATYCARHDMH